MNSLYEITNNFLDLMNRAEEGEITEEEYNKIGEELALQLQAKSPNLKRVWKPYSRFWRIV